ncbi:MAG TPA: pentapeptide repeat-containing protein [Magnetospirillaceae bacterium]|nr:pentapeptide repeat-containing protein [Magnetospirillaceae bacterium]
MAGLSLENLDFGKRRFYGCNFSHTSMRNVLFKDAVLRMCFFDFAVLESCDFTGADVQFCSFAGCHISDTTLENCELVHNNFNGAQTRGCAFNCSNLYNSRFILSEFTATGFVDCNIKKAYFLRTKENNVSFKFSNTLEAVFDAGHEEDL